MAKVETLHKDQKVYKIDGEAFKRVRTAVKRCDRERDELHKMVDEVNKRSKTISKTFWGAIYKELGVTLDDKKCVFNEQYESLGFYTVEIKEDSECDIGAMLAGQLMGD